MPNTTKPKRRGRPPGPTPPLTPAERKAAQRARLTEAGGRELTVRLDAKANKALARHTMPTETDAINHAIVETWGRKRKKEAP